MSAKNSKRILAAVSMIAMALIWICWFMWPREEERVVTAYPDQTAINQCQKRILYWGYYFGIQWKDAGCWPLGSMSCSGGVECFVSDDEFDYVSSDAVIFHSASGTVLKNLPSASLRPSRQVWVFLTSESPPHVGTFYKEKSIINWTLTYLRKSDIVSNYGKILPGRFNGGFKSSRNYLEGKNRSVVAVISNCMWKRLKIVKRLSKFIDVDTFGHCGKQRLCHDCWEHLQHYKFYLAFENTICIDYVTEKFYSNGLKYGMVPVVLGGANYSDPSIAPPGSYINVRNFKSLQQLAEFLTKVGSDPQLYNEYFHWHSHYKVVDNDDGICELCTLLCEKRPPKVYDDVVKWYQMEGQCEEYPNVPRKASVL